MKQVEAGQALPLNLPVAVPTASSRVADYLALTKPRLNLLVVATTAVGYYLGARDLDPVALAHTVVGTALVAGGASALNQVYERQTDGMMYRTRRRPLPDGRLKVAEATLFGAMLAAAGLLQLAAGANLLSAGVALVTLVCYTLVYTPLKPRTSAATVVGAVPGALPPAIGWAAATGRLPLEAWILFAIVFLWQMPHFLAIAWMYRDDFARAGFPVLPVVEPDGRSTGRHAVFYASALVPVSLLPATIGLAGRWYATGALALGAALLVVAIEFAGDRTTRRARSLFLASIVYLPLLWVLMIADRVRF